MHWIAIAWDIAYGIFMVALLIFLIWGVFTWTPRKVDRKTRKAIPCSEYGGFIDRNGQYIALNLASHGTQISRCRGREAKADRVRRSEMRW